jgi:hypothetical protein
MALFRWHRRHSPFSLFSGAAAPQDDLRHLRLRARRPSFTGRSASPSTSPSPERWSAPFRGTQGRSVGEALRLSRPKSQGPTGRPRCRGREARLSSRAPLPPNRTGGSPASGSPVGGFTSARTDGSGRRLWRRRAAQAQPRRSYCPPWTPHIEGRQHPVRPYRRFHPRPAASNLSGLLSPFGHLRRALFRLPVRHESTFLSPFAPRPLRRFLATMETPTPRQISASGEVSLLHALTLRDPSASTHLTLPTTAFARYPSAWQVSSKGLGFATGWQARRRVRPNRVRPPADGSFTVGCSPPRLAATQFPLVTGRRAYAWRGLPPLCVSTLAGAPAQGVALGWCAKERLRPEWPR